MKYITIGRQFGSGGREIGKQVADRLGLPYYDKELIGLASSKSGISEGYLESLDEKGTANFFHSLMSNTSASGTIIPNYFNIPMNDQLFFLQSDIIKELAKKGSCVITGRCADYILEGSNVLSVFIYAQIASRIKKISERHKITFEEAESEIQKIDKKRRSYYNHYTSKKWGNVESYHLSIDSSKFSIDKIVDIIVEAYNNI